MWSDIFVDIDDMENDHLNQPFMVFLTLRILSRTLSLGTLSIGTNSGI